MEKNTKRKETLVLICQSPGDLQYILQLYENNNEEKNIGIIVVAVKKMYEFLLALKLDLVFIHYFEKGAINIFRNPIVFLRERNRIRKITKKVACNLENATLFFFSHYYDWVTFFIASKLLNKQEVIFVDHFDSLVAKSFYRQSVFPKNFIKLALLFILTGIWFIRIKYAGSDTIEFPYWKYKIKKVNPPSISSDLYKKYEYQYPMDKPAALFMETKPRDSVIDLSTYQRKVELVIDNLKAKGWNLYLKAHPRVGASEFLEKMMDGIISSEVPSEFLCYQSFSLVIGIGSSGLVLPALKNVSVVSLLDIFDFSDDFKERVRKRLAEASVGKICFVNSIEEFNGQI